MVDVSSWIDFCRQQLTEKARLPYLTERWSEQEHQHSADLSNNMEETLRKLEEEGFCHPEDVAIRYATLRLCRGFIIFPVGERFSHLVQLVAPEMCSSWPRLAWEISNAYLAEQWDLLWSLFARADTLDQIDRQEVCLLRTQFRFLQLFGSQIDHELQNNFNYWYEWNWSLDGYAESNGFAKWPNFERPERIRPGSIEHYVLFRWCTNPYAPRRVPADDDSKKPEDVGWVEAGGEMVPRSILRSDSEEVDFISFPPPTIEAQGRLHAAIERLTSAISIQPEIAPQYRPLLARCLFVSRQYAEAADCYQKLMDHDRYVFHRRIKGVDLEDSGEEELLLSLANCYRLEGNCSKVEECMVQLLRIRPFGTYLKLARIQAEMGEYQEAYENLRREADINPMLEGNSWRATVLALGQVGEDQTTYNPEIARAFREAEPQAYATYVSIIEDYWPRFSTLSEPAQEAWVLGTSLKHDLRGDQRMLDSRSILAAFQFACAVEFELQNKVFGPFRTYTREVPTLQSFITSEPQQGSGGKKMNQRFLDYVVKEKTVLTLGEMARVIKNGQGATSRDLLGFEFAKWLKQHHEQLSQRRNQDVLELVAHLRNDAKAKRLRSRGR
ncbi:MAG: tetratricopeptide repeat protein [Terriglobales bacterium]